jgi:curli biogenesis system outer membrane secretion channel CsgG
MSNPARGFRRRARAALATAALTLLTACQPPAETAYDVQHPRTAPVRNIGNFNQALRCMDDMFLAQGKQDIYITTAGIPDATGLIAAGTKEMFITAVSRMSAKSNAFRFVDYDPTQLDVQVLSELVGLHDDFVAPNYYVRGAITQLDSNVLQSSTSAGVSIPYMDLAINGNQVVSVVSIDLNVGKLITRQILPGISASNSIAVVQSGKGADVGGLIGKAGLSLSVSLDKSEGFHQAVRNLIELSTIEVLGKLSRVPYWQCLTIESTNPNYRTEARGWFDTMGERERERFVSTALVRSGYLRSEADGTNAGLPDAIARYQVDSDLVPSGRVDFDLYYRLLANEARRPTSQSAAATPVAAGSIGTAGGPLATPAPPPAEAPRLTLTTPRGPRPGYRVGETMVVAVQPTQDAYVYCYYQDSTGTVARIFPNRFQPDPFLRAGTRVEIPPAGTKSFALRFDKPGGSEAVACLGADREIGLRLPNRLKAQDLEPLPVSGLDEVASQFREMPGARVDDARLAVEVMR